MKPRLVLKAAKSSHRLSLHPWKTRDTHVPLHASWSLRARFALLPLLPSAALRSLISRLSWGACLKTGGG